jgi:hypothetical protein
MNSDITARLVEVVCGVDETAFSQYPFFSLPTVYSASSSGTMTKLSERYGSTLTDLNFLAETLFSKRTSSSA